MQPPLMPRVRRRLRRRVRGILRSHRRRRCVVVSARGHADRLCASAAVCSASASAAAATHKKKAHQVKWARILYRASPPQRRIFLALYSRYCGVFRVKVSQYQDFMCKTSIIWDSRVLTVVLNRAEGRIGGQTAGIPQGGHVHSVCAQGSAVPAVQDPAQSDGGVCNAVYYNVFRRLFWRCGFLRQRVSCSCAVSAISTHR